MYVRGVVQSALNCTIVYHRTIMCIEHYLKIHRKNEKRKKRQERKCTKEANIIK